MLHKLDGDRNTVFAATTLHSDEAKRVLLRFGFSDKVRVYLNGRPLYRANDAFQTREVQQVMDHPLHPSRAASDPPHGSVVAGLKLA